MDDVLLRMEPHTKAKHKILEAYLKAWFPILSRWNGKIVYLDGFAGPGEYDDGSPGSPIIAIEVARTHRLQLAREVLFIFIEKELGRYQHLRKLLDQRYQHKQNGVYEKLPSNFRVYTHLGEFNTVMSQVLKGLKEKGASLAPTLAFVDPFGYSDINVQVLADILSFEKCELLITYMVGFLDRFAYDVAHRYSIKKAFLITDEQIKEIIAIQERKKREERWLALLRDRILAYMKEREADKKEVYPLYFRTIDRNNNTMYYLVHFTKSPKGREVMKEAMWKIGREGEYVFSDVDFQQGVVSILDYIEDKIWMEQAARQVYEHFKGKTVDLEEISRFVIIDTPYIWRKEILKRLETRGNIEVIGMRQKSLTYPEGIRIRFI
jgi:three-Cys-motif partner protein